jgi:hypothetical protein
MNLNLFPFIAVSLNIYIAIQLFNCDYFHILRKLVSVWIYGMNKLIDWLISLFIWYNKPIVAAVPRDSVSPH